jgi:hypothetical protein
MLRKACSGLAAVALAVTLSACSTQKEPEPRRTAGQANPQLRGPDRDPGVSDSIKQSK